MDSLQVCLKARAVSAAHHKDMRADQIARLGFTGVEFERFVAHRRGLQLNAPAFQFERDVEPSIFTRQVFVADAYGRHDERQSCCAHVARVALQHRCVSLRARCSGCSGLID